ncbi:GNAT family N-acetyltransferase [Streptomyces canus]
MKELYVRDTLRPQRIGARLMDELRVLAAARTGCSRVEWMADRDNPGARAFYESRGSPSCSHTALFSFRWARPHPSTAAPACVRISS